MERVLNEVNIMNSFMPFLQKHVIPKASKIANERHLAALRDAMVLTIPFIIIGSIFLILADFPIPAYLNFLKANPSIQNALLYPYNATFNIVALVATFGMSYKLAESYNVDSIGAGLIALASYFLVSPIDTLTVHGKPATFYNTNIFTSQGLFVGLLIAIISTEIYRIIVQRNITIKMPNGVPPTVSKSFSTIIPGFCSIMVVWVLRLIIEQTPFKTIQNLIQTIIAKPLTSLGTSFWGTLAVFVIINLLWCIGLHGSIIANSVMLPIWLQLTSQNAAALAAGKAAENIASAEFRYIIFVGGSGATLGLVVAMAFFAKSAQYKKLGRLSLAPSIFNINEPVLFGFPVVFNPVMWIPFILMAIITVCLTYLSMQFGIVSKPIGVLPPGTTPMIIGGYIMTGGISGAILQIIIFIISFLVYYPFFKVEDKIQYEKELKSSKA